MRRLAPLRPLFLVLPLVGALGCARGLEHARPALEGADTGSPARAPLALTVTLTPAAPSSAPGGPPWGRPELQLTPSSLSVRTMPGGLKLWDLQAGRGRTTLRLLAVERRPKAEGPGPGGAISSGGGSDLVAWEGWVGTPQGRLRLTSFHLTSTPTAATPLQVDLEAEARPRPPEPALQLRARGAVASSPWSQARERPRP